MNLEKLWINSQKTPVTPLEKVDPLFSEAFLHNIASPLTTLIMTFAEVETTLPVSQRRTVSACLHYLQDSVGHAQHHLHQHAIESHCCQFSLHRVLRQIRDLHIPEMKKAKIKMVIPPRNHVLLYGDRSIFTQMVENLVRNSIEALTHPGVQNRNITFSICQDSQTKETTLTCIDSGPGISEKNKQALFRPFVSTKARKNHGGLGLHYVAHHMRHTFQGSYQAGNTQKGGAYFALRFPNHNPRI